MIKYASSQDPVVNDFTSFLLNYGFYIAMGIAGVILVIVIVLLILQLKKRNNAPKVVKKVYSNSEIFDALGGKENILTHSKAGSRISLTLNNYDLVNEEKLNQLGIDSIVKMSNKITLVVKDDSESFYKLFE